MLIGDRAGLVSSADRASHLNFDAYNIHVMISTSLYRLS